MLLLQEEENMAKCARCGKAIGNAKECPHCGSSPSQSVINKGVDRMARATGTVLVKGIEVTDMVVKEAKPVVRTVLHEGRKGLSKAKSETLKIAKSLKGEGR
jgi:primosomal protein N'